MAEFYIEPPAKTGDGDAPPKFTIEPPPAAPAAASAAPAAAPSAPAPFEPLGETQIDRFGQQMGRTLVPPVVNFLTTPLRAPGAALAGVVHGALPVDEPSREKFYAAKQRAMDQTAIPETEGGRSISDVLGAPGAGIGSLARALGDATVGPKTTDAIAPYVSSAAEIGLPALGVRQAARRGAAANPGIQPTPPAAAARAAGYSLPPEEITAEPSLTSRALSALSGKYKKQQAFSETNQANTNSHAARAIGLPADARLTDQAFNRARQPAIQAYDAVRAAIPETVLGADPAFHQAVSQIGVRSAETERFFPEMEKNPSIVELRNELLENGAVTTQAAMDKIAALRAKSAENMRAHGGDAAHQHELGYAQRQAANAMEEAVERSIGYGTPRIQAMAARAAAEEEVARQTALNQTRGYGPGRLPQAQAALQAADAALNALPPVTAAEVAQAQAIRQQFQRGRQLFARIYDVESATNRATGDVMARRVAALRRGMRRPLTGELEAIANASDAFPKETQFPGSFGHLEDFSILDVMGGVGAAAAGHPVAGAVLAGRHPARGLLTSPWMQDRMFNRQPPMSSRPAGYVAGTAATPPVEEDDPLARALR